MTRSERAFISFFSPGLAQVSTTLNFSLSSRTLVVDCPFVCSCFVFSAVVSDFAFSAFAFSWAITAPAAKVDSHMATKNPVNTLGKYFILDLLLPFSFLNQDNPWSSPTPDKGRTGKIIYGAARTPFTPTCSIAFRTTPLVFASLTISVSVACAPDDRPFGSATVYGSFVNASGKTFAPGRSVAIP